MYTKLSAAYEKCLESKVFFFFFFFFLKHQELLAKIIGQVAWANNSALSSVFVFHSESFAKNSTSMRSVTFLIFNENFVRVRVCECVCFLLGYFLSDAKILI